MRNLLKQPLFLGIQRDTEFSTGQRTSPSTQVVQHHVPELIPQVHLLVAYYHGVGELRGDVRYQLLTRLRLQVDQHTLRQKQGG